MKSIIVDGVSRAVVVVDGDIESEEVIDCAGKDIQRNFTCMASYCV